MERASDQTRSAGAKPGELMIFPFVRYARYGMRTLLEAALLLGGAGALGWVYVSPGLAVAPGALLLFCLYFFRDPNRTPPPGEENVLAPADGRVMDIEELDEAEFVGGRCLRIGIFMSLFNVHVNRSPVSGRVERVSHRPGRFLAAFRPEAARENESNLIGIRTASGLRVAVRQIAGVVARRIVCGCRRGEELARGQRIGMIKFGSRVEVYLPAGAVREVSVRLGDKIRAGASVVAVLEPDRAEAPPAAARSEG